MSENQKNKNYLEPLNDNAQLQELYQKRVELYKKTNQLKNASDAQKNEYNQYQVKIDKVIEEGANLN